MSQEPANIEVQAAPQVDNSILGQDTAVPGAASDEKHSWFSDERGNLKFVNFIVKRPCCFCWSVLVLCLAMTVLLGAVAFPEGNPITDSEADYDLYDVRSKAYDSYRLAKEAVEDARVELQGEGILEPSQGEAVDVVYWIFEAEGDDGVFTTKGIEDIRKAVDIFVDHKDWSSYCKLEYMYPDGTEIPASEVACKRPMSPTNIFYPENWDSALALEVVDWLKDSANVADFNTVAKCLLYEEQLGAEFCAQETAGVSQQQQAKVAEINGKISTITNKWTGTGELVQDPKEVALFCAYLKLLQVKAFLVDFYFDKDFNVDNGAVSMYTRTILEFGGPLEGYDRVDVKTSEQEDKIKDYVLDNLYDDMEVVSKKSASAETNTFYFMGALIFDIFIGILLADTTKAVVSVLVVFLYLWYMLGSLFLACVGMGEILLSLPCAWFLFRVIFQIGYFSSLNTLCVFIVAAIGADDIFVFMDAYKQSAHQGPEVTRDLETRMSWVFRKSGTAMSITSATTCLAFLCTLFTPIASTQSFGIFAAFVILFDFCLVMSFFCTAVIIYHNRFERPPACDIPYVCGCCTEGCACGDQDPSPTQQTLSSFHDGAAIPEDKVTRFFSTHFSDFILSTKGRVAIAVCLVAWLVPAILWVTKLEATKTAEQFLDDNHPLQYSITILNNEFPVSTQDEGLRVYFTWGVDTLDQGGVNQLLDPDNIGKPVFKERFEFAPECQTRIKQACADLQATESQARAALLKRDDRGLFVVKCVTNTFEPFAAAMGLASADGTVPLADVNAAVGAYMESPPQVEDIEQVTELFGWDGTRLRYVSVSVESQELDQYSNLAEEVTRAQYDAFIELAEELDAMVGDACGASGVLMTDLHQKFIFMNNQRIYRRSAVQGAVIGVAIAFCVLCVATRSLLLSFLSTLSILSCIMSVIGVVSMLGWTLGTVEAILISILAGFSVDYVVHLAHAFASAKGATAERVRHAFGEMGTPVLSGMLTSVLASLPLFSCQIVFFAKFGTFLCFTILWSWVFANFAFMGALATIGPASPGHDPAADPHPKDDSAEKGGSQPQESEMAPVQHWEAPPDRPPQPPATFGQAAYATPNQE